MRRLLATMLLGAVVTLTACQSAPVAAPGPAPASQAEPVQGEPVQDAGGCLHQEEQPAIPVARVDGDDGPWVQWGTCTRRVGLQVTTVTFRLPPSLYTEDGRAGLQFTGPGEPRLYADHGQNWTTLQVELPQGQAGDRITVQWRGAVGIQPIDLGFALERAAPPEVVVERRTPEGAWAPVTEAMLLPKGPVTVRFRLLNGAPGARVRAAVEKAAGQVVWRELAPDLLEATIPKPPSFLQVDWFSLRAEQGWVVSPSLALYSGEAPRLVALNPITGAERVIGEVPLDVHHAALSPDGQYALLIALDARYQTRDVTYLVDTASGQVQRTDLPFWDWETAPYFPQGRIVVGDYDRVAVWEIGTATGRSMKSTGSHWGPVSPDGRWLAGYAPDLKREDEEQVAPASLILFDMATGAEQTLPDLSRVYVTHSWAPMFLPMYWEADSRHLLVAEFAGRDLARRRYLFRWRRVDTATRAHTPYDGPEQPDPYAEWRPGPGGWQLFDPMWTAYGFSAWTSPLKLRASDGTVREFGDGLAAGWSPSGELLVVRWAMPERRARLVGE